MHTPSYVITTKTWLNFLNDKEDKLLKKREKRKIFYKNHVLEVISILIQSGCFLALVCVTHSPCLEPLFD